MTLVAVGDSLVHAADSWPSWLARAMGQELRRVSMNGARSDDVLVQAAELGGERYDVACLSVGGNDVLFDWDPEVYAARLAEIVAALGASADRVVASTLNRSLGAFPGSGSELRRRVEEANAVIRGCGATLISGEDLRGPRLLQPDRVHPTLEGQLLLADRAATALGITPPPSSLAYKREDADRWAFHRVAAGQLPRRALKRMLGRPMYRDTRRGQS